MKHKSKKTVGVKAKKANCGHVKNIGTGKDAQPISPKFKGVHDGAGTHRQGSY